MVVVMTDFCLAPSDSSGLLALDETALRLSETARSQCFCLNTTINKAKESSRAASLPENPDLREDVSRYLKDRISDVSLLGMNE